MSLPKLMPIEDLFAYDPNKAGAEVNRNPSEFECARAIVEQELSLHFDESTLPEELVSLLNDAWKEVLAAIYVEEGFGSIRWILAMEITDELVWTLQPKRNLAERTKMIGMLPTMIKVLRQGLASVEWDKTETESLFDSLSNYHMSILRGEKLSRRRSKRSKAAEPVKGPKVDSGHNIELLSDLDQDDEIVVSSGATAEKGWHYRADTNEWVYQGESIQKTTATAGKPSASSTGRTRKIGSGDH